MAGEVERDAIGVWRGVVCCTVGSAVLVSVFIVCFFVIQVIFQFIFVLLTIIMVKRVVLS